MSSNNSQLALPFLNSGNSCAEGATVASADPGSVVWKKGRRLSTYSPAELAQLLSAAKEAALKADYNYTDVGRYQSGKKSKAARGAWKHFYRIKNEMINRGVLFGHDEKVVTGKKGDHGG